jgi:hypothetical protein
MNKNYDAEMDYILEQLVKAYEDLYNGMSFYSDADLKSTKDTVTKNVMEQFGLKDWEINLLYYTLFIDTHIKSIDPLTISLGGLVFRNNGGYSERTKAKLLEAQRLENIQNAFRKDSLGLMIFTAIVAFGTMISAFYFALEVYRYFTGK